MQVLARQLVFISSFLVVLVFQKYLSSIVASHEKTGESSGLTARSFDFLRSSIPGTTKSELALGLIWSDPAAIVDM